MRSILTFAALAAMTIAATAADIDTDKQGLPLVCRNRTQAQCTSALQEDGFTCTWMPQKSPLEYEGVCYLKPSTIEAFLSLQTSRACFRDRAKCIEPQ